MFKVFEQYRELRTGISNKSDGTMNFKENRKKFLKSLGFQTWDFAMPLQSHSTNAVSVNSAYKDIEADALATGLTKTVLAVTIADCFPVYFYAPEKKVIALAHSGWRGTAGNIVASTVKIMRTRPDYVIAGIGPGIGRCHFEVRNDTVEKFNGYPESIIYGEGKIFIDLAAIIAKQLADCGIKKQNIENLDQCTYCEKEAYFSYRRDKPEKTESMLAYMALSA